MTSLPKILKLKDYITLCGSILGIVSLICASLGTRFFISLGFFLISLTLGTDLLDGYIARKTGTTNQFGIELDSLSDSLTFGIAPAILIFQAFRRGDFFDFIIIIGCICFALGAILRLARFNISEEEGYTGVPTPLSCLIIIVFFYTNYFYAFGLGGLEYQFPDISYYILPILLITIGWFNITTHITIGDKSKSFYIFVLSFAPISPILGIIGLTNPNYITSMIVFVFFLFSFSFLFGYCCVGFFKKSERNKDLKEPT